MKTSRNIEKIIAGEIQEKTGLDKKKVYKCIEAYWNVVRQYIDLYNFITMTEDEYNKIKYKRIYMPRFGSFEIRWDWILKKQKQFEYAKNKRR